MKIKQIQEILNAEVITGSEHLSEEIQLAFASDLMSDVLRLQTDDLILITGLANLQSIRTAEMADIQYVIFARGKRISEDMLELAKENDMLILQVEYSVYKTSGLLFEAGLKAVY
ncbi:MAG: hypothetical protein JEZ03_16090 [Bacteroidales bacterium]|nr:hypothetical protein [Bacteroidales bacterium]